MNRKYKVGIVGGTGMVGQRFISLLNNHPWFEVTAIAASEKSAGKCYEESIENRWKMDTPVPDSVKSIKVMNAADAEKFSQNVDFVFSAVDMKKDEIKALEEKYAKAETPVISNNSAHRWTPDVPMLIPEVNAAHTDIIGSQMKRLGTKNGFIAVKPNCSIQSYVPAIHALLEYKPVRITACTYQAISGAGKTFTDWPEMVDNVIPYIGGEEEKSETEPLKIWGSIQDNQIIKANKPQITTQCIRVPVTDGHMAAVFISFEGKPKLETIIELWNSFEGKPQKLKLPSAPDRFLKYFPEADRPQTKLDRDAGNGMGITVGRLREDAVYDFKFVCLSHNTVRGAAGGAVLIAELLKEEGYLKYK